MHWAAGVCVRLHGKLKIIIIACRAVCWVLFAFFSWFKWISVFIFIFTRTVCKFNLFTALTARLPACLPVLPFTSATWINVQVQWILHKCIKVRGEELEFDELTFKVSSYGIFCITNVYTHALHICITCIKGSLKSATLIFSVEAIKGVIPGIVTLQLFKTISKLFASKRPQSGQLLTSTLLRSANMKKMLMARYGEFCVCGSNSKNNSCTFSLTASRHGVSFFFC